MRKSEAVQLGAKQLVAAENAVEMALCEVAKLGQVLGEARMSAGLSAVIGQDVIEGIAMLYRRLAKARHEAVKLHGALDDVKTQIGARHIVAMGTGNKTEPGEGDNGILRVVDNEAA